MEIHVCLACARQFLPRPQNPTQSYCSKQSCQCERRRRWQQAKRATDQDYRDNQKRAQQAWRARNPEYWRQYRDTHPQYTVNNRAQQLARNYRNRTHLIAKMDVSTPVSALPGGLYSLSLVPDMLIAKKNAWIVFLSPYSPSVPLHVP